MIDLNTITKEYIISLQEYINNIEGGKHKYKDFKYSKDLEIILKRCTDIGETSKLSCFNGVYDINKESFDYYIKKLTSKYNLKLKKEEYFPYDWIVVDKKQHECSFSIMKSPHNIKGVNTKRICVEFHDSSAQMFAYSFLELDSILSTIKDGSIFEVFEAKYNCIMNK